MGLTSKIAQPIYKKVLRPIISKLGSNPIWAAVSSAFTAKGFDQRYSDAFAAWYVTKNASLAGVVEDEIQNRDHSRLELTNRATTFATNQSFAKTDIANADLGIDDTDLTFSVWIRGGASLANDGRAVSCEESGKGYLIGLEGTDFAVGVYDGSGTLQTASTGLSKTDLQSSNAKGYWVKGIYDHSASKLYCSLNGKRVSETACTGFTASTANTLAIGRAASGAARNWEGEINHCSVWVGHALSEQDDVLHFDRKWSRLTTPTKHWLLSGANAWDQIGTDHLTSANSPTLSEDKDNATSPYDYNFWGYTNNSGTIVPAQWGSTTTDAQGNTLQYSGEVARNGTLLGGPCVDLNGTNQYGVITNSDDYSGEDWTLSGYCSTEAGGTRDVLSQTSGTGQGRTIFGRFTATDKWVTNIGGSASQFSNISNIILGREYFFTLVHNYSSSSVALSVTDLTTNITESETLTSLVMESADGDLNIGANRLASVFWSGSIWGLQLDCTTDPAKSFNCPISEESGDTSYDISGNGKDIAWQNSPSLSGTQDSYFHGEAVGYSLYEHASTADILVPLKADGTALTITPPSGYSKTGDYPAGPYHNNTQATLQGYLANSDSEADIYFGASFNGSSSVVDLGDIGNTTQVEFDLYVPNVTGTKALIQLASGDYLQLNGATLEANDIAGATFYVDGVAGTTIAATTWQTVKVTYTVYDSTAVKIGNQASSFLTGYVRNLSFKNSVSDVVVLPLYKDSLDRSSNCNHGTDTAITYLNNPASEIAALNPTIASTETLAQTDGNKNLILLGSKI